MLNFATPRLLSDAQPCRTRTRAREEELNPCMSPCPMSWSHVQAPAWLTPALSNIASCRHTGGRAAHHMGKCNVYFVLTCVGKIHWSCRNVELWSAVNWASLLVAALTHFNGQMTSNLFCIVAQPLLPPTEIKPFSEFKWHGSQACQIRCYWKLNKRSKGISACWTWLDSKVSWYILKRTCLNSAVEKW